MASLARTGVTIGLVALAFARVAMASGPAAEDAVVAGRRLYREGRVASGEAVTAIVQGDVPVLGTQLTCLGCHRRSGMGAIESGLIVPPLVEPLLFAPDPHRQRPAYTLHTLARALREGIDPVGRPLDPLMPRFRIADGDVSALFAYLRQLGAAPSPGAEPDNLRLATVVAGDVSSEVERAVLDVLEAFLADRNRVGRQRLRGGHAPGQPREAFRAWSLDVWRLEGGPERWRGQLEAHQRARPAFALLSGMAAVSWQPVHDFCEAAEIPCLLPNADLPPADDDAFYSFYFSRGLRLEAEIIAAALASDGLASDVLGVVGADGRSGEASTALARALEKRGGSMRMLDLRGEPDSRAAIARALAKPTGAIALWLRRTEVERAATILGGGGPPLFLSSTLVEAPWDDLPASVRARGRVVHLRALPGEPDPSLGRFHAWARARGVRLREERHQAQAYFACLAFSDAAKHAGRFTVRDYFIDVLDHASSLTAFLPLYPRAGLTPGQRVLSRGGYVVDLSDRVEPAWVVP